MRDYLGTIVDIEECCKQTGRTMACLTESLNHALEELSYHDMPTHFIEWFILGFEEKHAGR